jgi:hypothetical protein
LLPVVPVLELPPEAELPLLEPLALPVEDEPEEKGFLSRRIAIVMNISMQPRL